MGLKDLSHEERLREMVLFILEKKRLRVDLSNIHEYLRSVKMKVPVSFFGGT